MHPDWLLHPLTHYGFLGFGMALCVYLCFVVERNAHAASERLKRKNLHLEGLIVDLRNQINGLRSAVEHSEQSAAPPAVAFAPSGMNLTKRSQVLRMYRRGEQPESIAAALHLPRTEVDLLLKLHRSVAESAEAVRQAG
jgi:hypothetical protein